MARSYADWAWGFLDETWWSRFTQPRLHTWCGVEDRMRLVEQTKDKADPDPKALACYGLLVRWSMADTQTREQMWLRFVDGRPVSGITIPFLTWCCAKLQALGKRVLVLIWDNASWHISKAVRQWIRAHNQQVKREGQGVRLLVSCLPVKSPWLNPIEAKWMHGKRRVVEAHRTLSAQKLADRVCATFHCAHEPHLSVPKEVI